MKHQLVFTGWNRNLKKVSFVAFLRDRAGMTFHAAKRVLEALLIGEKTIIEAPNVETAKEIKRETTKLGAKSKIVNITSKKTKMAHKVLA